jgi:hypothetical protein
MKKIWVLLSLLAATIALLVSDPAFACHDGKHKQSAAAHGAGLKHASSAAVKSHAVSVAGLSH